MRKVKHDFGPEGNESDWKPPAGTVKKRCTECQRWFASRGTTACLVCKPEQQEPRMSRGRIK